MRMNNKTCYVIEFNINIVKLLNEIVKQGLIQNRIKNIQFFHLNQKDYPQKISVDVINYEGEKSYIKYLEYAQEDKWLGYYWVQFEYDSKRYKIDMFFRACDRETGNLHIFPGPMQIFVEEKYHGHSYIKNGRYHNVGEDITSLAYKGHHGSKQYCEEQWVPIKLIEAKDQDIPMLWNIADISDIAKKMWNSCGFESIYDMFETISVTNRQPISIHKFYSINGKYENWYDILYPPEKKLKGRKLCTAYCMLRFKSNSDYQIHNFHIFEVEGYGYFNIFSGESRNISYNDKIIENKKYKDDKYFLAGPNYLVENEKDKSKKDWKFIYPRYSLKNNLEL